MYSTNVYPVQPLLCVKWTFDTWDREWKDWNALKAVQRRIAPTVKILDKN